MLAARAVTWRRLAPRCGSFWRVSCPAEAWRVAVALWRARLVLSCCALWVYASDSPAGDGDVWAGA